MVIFTITQIQDKRYLPVRPALLSGGCGQRTAATATVSVMSLRAVFRTTATRTTLLLAWYWDSHFDRVLNNDGYFNKFLFSNYNYVSSFCNPNPIDI